MSFTFGQSGFGGNPHPLQTMLLPSMLRALTLSLIATTAFAQGGVSIPNLPAIPNVQGSDVIIDTQGTTTGIATVNQLMAFVSQNGSPNLNNATGELTNVNQLPQIAAGTILGVPAQSTGPTNPTALTRPTFYVQDFGAKCDNSTDDTSALASAFAAAQAKRFSSVILPPGVCRFSSTLNFPTNYSAVRGAGKYTTVLFYIGATTTADLVDIFGTSISVLGVSSTYSGFSVQSASAMTGGAGINIKWCIECWLDDFATGGFYDATNNLYNGTIVQSSGEIRLSNFEASKLANDGIEVFGGGVGAPPQYDVNIHHFEIQSDGNAGIHMGGGWDGMNVDEGTLVGNGTNILIDTALSSFGNQEAIFGPRVYLNLAEANGTNIGDNIVINDSLASPTNYCSITFNGVIANSAHENGINVVHWPACILSIAATDIVNNAKSGIYVQDTSTIVNVSNVTQIYGNTRYGIEGSSSTTNVNSLASFASNTLGSYHNVIPNTLAIPPPIGATTPSTGAFTTLSATSTVSGTGFSTYLASPPAIGGTTPAAITGTTVTTPVLAGTLAAGMSVETYQATPLTNWPTTVQGSIQSNIPMSTIGNHFTASNSCGGTATYNAGGAAGGYFTVSTGGTNCLLTITIGGATPISAPTAWFCHGEDFTSGVVLAQSNQTGTTCVLKVPTLTASDIILWAVVTGY